MNRALVSVLGLSAMCLVAPPSFGQAPTLTINGITSNVNGAVVDTPFGSRIVVEIADVGNANGSYALAGAFAHNANSVGWWLAQAGTYPFIKPWPLLTGIPTSVIEAEYQTDLYPDSSGAPFIKLNAQGRATLIYQIPSKDHFPPGFTASVFFQAVTRDAQSNLDVTNGLELFIHAASLSGRLTLARGTVGGADNLSVEIGTLRFDGDPSGATYTRDLTGPFDTGDVAATGFFELIKNEASDTGNLTSFQAWSRLGVGRYRENANFARLVIPAATAPGGKAIPARDLFRIADLTQSTSGFLIVNQGENPNTPGVRAFLVPGSMRSDPSFTGLNKEYWQHEILLGWDNLHALVAVKPNDLTQPDHLFIMTLDGSTPYTDPVTQLPSSLLEITPAHDPVWLRLPTNAAAVTRDRFYFFGSANQNFTNFDDHGLYVVPLDGSTSPVAVTVDPLRKNNQDWRGMDEKSTLVSNDGSTFAFIGQYDTKTEDWYALNVVTNPTHAINISGWTEDTKLDQPGTATDGNALAGISPSGRWVAYYKDRSNADDLFLASTDGSFAENNKRVSSVFGSGVDDGRDPVFTDDDHLVFWYGSDSGPPFKMDLYRYRISDNSYYNLTNTSGERVLPFTKTGTIYSRGEFFSASRRYMYFIRDNRKTSQGNELANVIGLDTVSWLVFDLTGSEFSSGWVPDVNGSIDSSSPKAETWSFMKGAGSMKNLMFFKAYYADRTPKTDQLFLFDTENPFSAIPLSNLTQADFFMRNISPASFGPFVAFTGSDDSTSQSVYVLDVSHLQLSLLDSNKSIQNGSLVFLPPIAQGNDAAPASLVYVIGTTPEANPTTNVQARFLDLEPGATPVTFPIVGGSELVHVLNIDR
ncbi:MAG: hypothetical protein U1E76_07345 [Planctomycetota bacterium]